MYYADMDELSMTNRDIQLLRAICLVLKAPDQVLYMPRLNRKILVHMKIYLLLFEVVLVAHEVYEAEKFLRRRDLGLLPASIKSQAKTGIYFSGHLCFLVHLGLHFWFLHCQQLLRKLYKSLFLHLSQFLLTFLEIFLPNGELSDFPVGWQKQSPESILNSSP